MEEGDMEDRTEKKEEKEKNSKPLPLCTTAPSPEHSRGNAEDEPCDDGRSGE
jgi:hypothetical protein